MTGKEIKIERVKRDLTQKQLAENVDCSKQTIGNIESGGNTHTRILNNIKEFFKQNPAEL